MEVFPVNQMNLASNHFVLQPVCVSSLLCYAKFSVLLIFFCLIAADIMKRIDETVDPCDDFYKFSCGGLDNKINLIPEDKSSLSTASLLQMDIDKKLRGMINFEIFPVNCSSVNSI